MTFLTGLQAMPLVTHLVWNLPHGLDLAKCYDPKLYGVRKWETIPSLKLSRIFWRQRPDLRINGVVAASVDASGWAVFTPQGVRVIGEAFSTSTDEAVRVPWMCHCNNVLEELFPGCFDG